MKKPILIVIFILLGLIIIAAGGLYFYKGKAMPIYGKVVTIPFIEKASLAVMNDALDSVNEVKAAHFILDFDMTAKATEQPAGNLNNSQFGLTLTPSDMSLSFSVASDIKAESDQSNDAQVSFDGQIGFSGATYDLAADIIYKADKLYLRITKFPAIPFFDLNSYLAKWYWYDMKEFAGDLNQLKLTPTTTNTNLSADQQDQLRRAVSDNPFLKIKERLPDETIDGEKCYHYALMVENEGFKNFIKAVNKIMPVAPASGKIEDYLKEMDAPINKLNEGEMEIFIGQKDGLPHKISFTGNYESDGGSFGYGDVGLSVSLTLSRFNESINVDAPDSTKSLDEVYHEIAENLSGLFPTGSNSDDAQIKSDLSMYRTSLVMYYDDNSQYPANVKSGTSDVLNDIIYNNYLEEYQTAPIEPATGSYYYQTNSKKDGFVIYGKLSTGKYYYITSTGNTGELSDVPSASLITKSSTNTNSSINTNTNSSLNQDSDNDGLTDMEEILYGTDANNPDTDGDGFKDGVEVDNGFNPNGEGNLATT